MVSGCDALDDVDVQRQLPKLQFCSCDTVLIIIPRNETPNVIQEMIIVKYKINN